MGCRNLLALVMIAMVLPAYATSQAQAPNYGLGTTPSAADIRTWDPVSMDGKELPAGSGTADEGAKIYEQKCAMCHGPNGRGGQAPDLVRSSPTTAPAARPYIFTTKVPFAPVLWDYINRAMPLLIAPGSLKPDQVYSLTAFLLYKNDIIKQADVLDAHTLPKVKMPNRDGFVPWKP